MTIDPNVTRRAVLAAAAGGAGAVCLAACGVSSANGPGSTPSAKPGVSLTKLDAVPLGSGVRLDLPDGSPVIVARPSATTAAAFSAICTHQGGIVNVHGGVLICPNHGSVFNTLTGAVEQGPAAQNLPKLAVHVAGDEVVTGSA